jgi:RHS repeat-associated protein
MLRVTHRNWFKACAVATTVSVTWLAVDGPAQAQTARVARERAERLDDVARRLGLDAGRVRGGAGWETTEGVRERQRRAAALARLERKTAPKADAVARVHRDTERVRQAHLPELLSAAAAAAEQVGDAARAGLAATDGKKRTRATQLLQWAAALLDRATSDAVAAGAEQHAPGLGEHLRRAKGLAGAAAPGHRAGLAEIARSAPPPRPKRDWVGHRPRLEQPLAPPAPRRGVRFGAAPSSEVRAFYASLLDAEGIQVETAAGTIAPAEIVAGTVPTLEVAMAGGLSTFEESLLLGSAGALTPPADGDLAEGPETRLTPEMRAAIAAAGGDPLRLYNLVHDQFSAEPYYGAKKGSVGAWAERAGNDADLSSLLVALLRGAGIPARFEYGNVELTPEQAMAWASVTDPRLAASVLASTGVPAQVIVTDGRVTAVQVEHVWVRAFVPYSNYRGLPRAESRSIWVRLDPTLKRVRYRRAVDLRGKASFDYDRYLATLDGRTPLSQFEQQLREAAAAAGLACRTLDDAIPRFDSIPDQLSLLPAELPSRLVQSLATFSGFPEVMRYTAKITAGGWSHRLALPETYGLPIALRYRGETAADQAAIDAAGGISGLARPFAVRIVPTLTVGGVEQGRGEGVGVGADQEVLVEVGLPMGGRDVSRHLITAGSAWAVGFPVGQVPDAVVAAREADWTRAVASGAAGDDLEIARANRVLWRYFAAVGRETDRIYGLEWMRVARGAGEGFAGRELAADQLWGATIRVRPSSLSIDVGSYAIRPYAIDGRDARKVEVALLAGFNGSAHEHLVWEQAQGVPAISTVRAFQVARAQGVPLQTIDATNASLVSSLPYDEAVIRDVTDKVHAGLTVRIPARPVSWDRYQGMAGYTITDVRTGAAEYRIQGHLNGGLCDGEDDPRNGVSPDCGCTDPKAGSQVGMTLGNMYFSETDLSVPARGIPVTFTRRYDSLSPHGGRLGPGWQHTWEVRVLPQPDGGALYVNDAFRTQRFTRASDGGFVAEPGYHERLEALTQGWLLTFKDGVQYRFRADGQLQSIQDPNGHLLQLRYDAAARPEAVIDGAQRAVLTFGYDDAGQLVAINSVDGRTVAFTHEGGDLVAVADVLGARQEYGYDAAHRLAWKRDRNGNTVQEFYDGKGRWIGAQEPDGQGRRMAYDMLNRRAVHTDKRGSVTIWEYNAAGDPIAVTDALGNRRTVEWSEGHDKLAEVDAQGHRTSMTWDTNGNLLSRTDALGERTSHTYDDRGRVLTTTDAAGKVATNVYDELGNLASASDATGATTVYGYTPDGLPETITQPGDASTVLGYRADGTVASVTDPTGGRTVIGYDVHGHIASITDPLGRARTMEADAAGRILAMTDATGARTTFEYDAEGNRTAVVDAEGNRTSFAYDTLNRLVAVTDATGRVTRTEYDPEGNVTARVDAVGRRSTYRYDIIGRLVETVDAAGAVTTQGYCADVGSQPCAIVDPVGNMLEVQFDALGRVTTTVGADGRTTADHYDSRGRRDWSKDAAGRVTSYGYDDAGRLRTVTDPAGGVTTYGYDGRGNRTSVQDANGMTTWFAYDGANRLISETNPIGKVTSYEYDLAGNRRFKTDGNGHRTEYVYDENRRLTKVLFADGTSYDFAYDARGNRILEQSPSHRRELGYDALGRLSTVADGGVGRTITYGYDALGNRTSMALDTGERVQYRWDALGRLAEVIDPQGDATRYRYDAAGRRSRVEYGNRTAATWAYDAAGQVTSIVYSNGAGEVLTAFGYDYDAAGNRKSKAFADGTRETYGYDALDRLTSVEYPTKRRVDYAYDPVGNRTSLVDTSRAGATRWAATATASSENWVYGYASYATGAPDVTGCTKGSMKAWQPKRSDSRVEWLEVGFAEAMPARAIRIHEIDSAPSVQRIDLIDEGGTAHTIYTGGDKTACGGWLSLSFDVTPYKVKKARIYTAVQFTTQSAAEGIDAVGIDPVYSEKYQYNGFNQLLSVTPAGAAPTTFSYDGNGNQLSRTDASGTTTYAYNYDNRLVDIAGPGGSSHFEYDANGLRTKKTDSTGTRSYLLDGLSVVAEYAPDASKLAWYTQSLARIDEVLNVVNGQGKYWYETDALGSTYAMTNASGGVASRSSYDVFGERTLVAGADLGQTFGYTGREHDQGGLVYARDRYASPTHGRWLQPDRYRPKGPLASADLYQFVNNQPTKFVDPSGKVPILVWLGVVLILSTLQNDEEGFDEDSPAWDVGWLLIDLPVIPVALKCLKVTIRFPLIREITKAAQLIDRNGFTFAGRALQKHGSRAGSVFPKLTGNPRVFNEEAEKIVARILKDPDSEVLKYTHRAYGQVVEVWAPNGMGIRFGSRGFMGFLDP